jgi:hypothetical protein
MLVWVKQKCEVIVLMLMMGFVLNQASALAFEIIKDEVPYPTGIQHIKLRTAKITVAIPKNWEAIKDMWGLPLSIYSPDHQSGDPSLAEDYTAKRSVLTVIPTGAKNVTLSEKNLAPEAHLHFEARKKDLEKQGATVISNLPYSYTPLTTKPIKGSPLGIHRIGVRFKSGDSDFHEISNYLVCDYQIFMLKALIPDESFATDNPLIENIVKSFKCE